MIVFVESNFILELVYRQEQSGSAAQILGFAKDRKIKLVLPSFSLVESLETIRRRTLETEKTLAELEKFRQRSGRTKERRRLAGLIGTVTGSVRTVDQAANRNYPVVLRKLVKYATRIELSEQIIMNSFKLEADARLKRPDAIILASIIADLTKRRGHELKLFVSRDNKDFGRPEVGKELKQSNCLFLSDFRDAVRRIRSESKKSSIRVGKDLAR